MAIALMTVCEWAAVGRRDTDVHQPSWDEVEHAIQALDGSARNDLYLYPVGSEPGTYLCVGGGNGRYIVTGAIGIDKEFPTVVEGHRPAEPKIPLVVGGQEGSYPSNWIVSLETALHAARSFYDSGGFAADFSWVRV